MEEELFWRKQALNLWQEGQRAQLEGDLDRACALYARSIEVFPTAEAYTFRGWALSFMERFEEAIDECKKAIAVDPSFGNPYNDIGSYLIALGKADKAIAWLRKAKKAPRYEPRHFPYMNLGRLYAAKGYVRRAIREYQAALRLAPGEPTCTSALAKLKLHLN